MTVIEDAEDRYGQSCIIFKTTNLKLINEWMYNHYGGNGWKFVIMLDENGDEYHEMNEAYVYFLDSLTDEFISYIGKDILLKHMGVSS